MTIRSAIGILLLATTALNAAPAEKPIPFDVYNGYFVSNKFEPNAPSSFVVIKDQKAFDETFGAGFVLNDRSHRLPKDSFKTKIVVAAIHRGKAMWDYKVQSVSADGKTLIVKYSADSTPDKSAEFSCPLIISIDKGGFTAVKFIENGKELKTVDDVDKASVAPAFDIKCDREGIAINVTTENNIAYLDITGTGIGGATLSRKGEHWPEPLILRVHLRGLESLTLTAGDISLHASVLSHSGNPTLLHLWKDGKEGPQLTNADPCWMEIKALDAKGNVTQGLPPADGCFEMTIPKPLLADDSKTLALGWIDFLR